MEKLTIEDYKALGEAIKQVKKNLKLISKLYELNGLDFVVDNFEEDLPPVISKLLCDLENFSYKLEADMDEYYPDDIKETIGFFN